MSELAGKLPDSICWNAPFTRSPTSDRFDLEMGSDLITEFSQIEDFKALHDWGKEKILPALLEEGEDEESQTNRLWERLSELTAMQKCASYAFHHKMISIISRKLRAVLEQTYSFAKEKAQRAEEVQTSNPSGIRMRPPTQASEGGSSGGIDYGRHPSPTSKGGKGKKGKGKGGKRANFPSYSSKGGYSYQDSSGGPYGSRSWY